MNGLGEDRLTIPIAVNIGMVEEIRPLIQRSMYKVFGLRRFKLVDAHASDCDARYFQT